MRVDGMQICPVARSVTQFARRSHFLKIFASIFDRNLRSDSQNRQPVRSGCDLQMAGLCIMTEAKVMERVASFEWQQVKADLDAAVLENIAEQEMFQLRSELQEARQHVRILRETVQHLSKENDELRLQAHLYLVNMPNIVSEIPVDKTCLSVADADEEFLAGICYHLSLAHKFQMKSEKLCHKLRDSNLQLWDAARPPNCKRQLLLAPQRRNLGGSSHALRGCMASRGALWPTGLS